MTPPSVVPNKPSVYKENKLPISIDNSPKFAAYANPRALVSTEWLSQNLGSEGLVVLESDEDVLLYQTGHIPSARKIDWHTDLNDKDTRDYINGEGFAAVMSRLGIKREDTIVLYGDKSNWWAAYALWVFKLFGHEDVRLLDGGRDKWTSEGRELKTFLQSNRQATRWWSETIRLFVHSETTSFHTLASR
jgi:thiosulfate/3-mercaptopyruvate sulfurtransferase